MWRYRVDRACHRKHCIQRASDARCWVQRQCFRHRHARALILRIRNFAALCVVAFAGCGAEISTAEVSDAERRSFYRAIEICKGMTKRPMALDLDKRVLCLDGDILPEQDLSLAGRLQEGGLFVVRSSGVGSTTVLELAELLRKRRASVVVYDYCLSTCASYLLFASATAFVRRNTLVAWSHAPGAHQCSYWVEAKDGGPKRLEIRPCADAPPIYRASYEYYKRSNERFYSERAVDPSFEDPPESVTVRGILWSKFGEIGSVPPDLLWTWNPRHYAGAIRTRVTYEAYPSQDEVDAVAPWFKVPVIHDP
jgi:hypothetical protein